MGNFIEIDGKMREVVRVKSDNPSHAGFYTTYRDQMKPGDEEHDGKHVEKHDETYEEPVAGSPEPVKNRRSRK